MRRFVGNGGLVLGYVEYSLTEIWLIEYTPEDYIIHFVPLYPTSVDLGINNYLCTSRFKSKPAQMHHEQRQYKASTQLKMQNNDRSNLKLRDCW